MYYSLKVFNTCADSIVYRKYALITSYARSVYRSFYGFMERILPDTGDGAVRHNAWSGFVVSDLYFHLPEQEEGE